MIVRCSLAQAAVAVTLAWSLIPGTRELTEQIVHLAANGHLAHSIPNDPDACPPDAEHGCEGPMHVCQCCPNVPLIVATAVGTITPPTRSPWVAWVSSAPHDDPHLDGISHPPKA